MAQKKVGEVTRDAIIAYILGKLKDTDYEVLQVGSASYSIPFVENGEEGAVKIVFQIPKGERTGDGYDPYEDAQAYRDHQEQTRIKAQKRAEEKARKLAKKKSE